MNHHHDHNHNHNHDHSHDHNHNHDQDQDHHHDIRSELTETEKLARLLNHWIAHNQSHADTYDQWARRIKDQGDSPTADLLFEAVNATHSISKLFEKALERLK